MCSTARSWHLSRRQRRAAAARALVLTVVFTALAFLDGTSAPAQAQTLETPRARQGYYLALGPHFALNQNREKGHEWGVWAGYDVTLRAGQMLTRRLGIGVQIHYGSARGEGQRATLFGLNMEGQWELAPNFALRGGLGLDTVGLATVGATDEASRGTLGAGYFLGLSYDWFFTHRRSGGWALTPVVQARLVPGDTRGLIGTIGVEITYWTGLPRHQLDLPPGEAFTNP